MLERFLSLVSGACKTGLKHLDRASWQSKDGIIVSPELSNMSSSWSVHKPERPWLLNKLPSAHFHIYFLLFGNRATHVASFFPCPLGTEVWQLYLGHLTRVVSWHFPLAPPDSAVRLLLATWHSVTPDVSSFLSSLLHASFPGENRTEPQSLHRHVVSFARKAGSDLRSLLSPFRTQLALAGFVPQEARGEGSHKPHGLPQIIMPQTSEAARGVWRRPSCLGNWSVSGPLYLHSVGEKDDV